MSKIVGWRGYLGITTTIILGIGAAVLLGPVLKWVPAEQTAGIIKGVIQAGILAYGVRSAAGEIKQMTNHKNDPQDREE